MLESIRERSGSVVVKIILVLVALTFALTGIGGYIASNVDDAVATVNGEPISRAEFERALESERNRQRQQLGDFYDTLAVDPGYNESLRSRVIDDLINQKVLEQFAAKQGLRLSDEQVKDAIRAIPAFRVAGQFDNDSYQFTLRSLGYTPDGFAELMRRDLARGQLLETIVSSEFALKTEAQQLQALVNQVRSGAYVTVALQPLLEQVEITDTQIEQWYGANQQQFAIAEQVKVEYLPISASALMDSITIDDATVAAWYESNRSRYVTADQYRFSHILIEGDDAAARERAAQALAAVQAGEDFAAVAGQYSDDLFSAEQGGDLDFIERGTMDSAFEEAAFALSEVGEVSGLVTTEFGFHIIKLTDKIVGKQTELAEVRDEIAADLTEQRLQQAYYELQQRAAQLAFEIPDSLAELATETGLEVRQSDWISRATAPADLRSPAVLQQLFNQDFIAEGLNSDVIEVSDTESLVVRVLDYQPASTEPLEVVREQVIEAVRDEQATALAEARAAELQAQLAAGEALTEQLVYMTDVSSSSSEYPRAVLQALFDLQAPAEGQSQFTTTRVTNGDIAVVQLTAVTLGSVDEASLVESQERLSNNQLQAMYAGLIEALRAEAEIEINRSNAVSRQ